MLEMLPGTQTKTRKPLSSSTLASMLLSVLLVACGGGGGSDGSSTPATSASGSPTSSASATPEASAPAQGGSTAPDDNPQANDSGSSTPPADSGTTPGAGTDTGASTPATSDNGASTPVVIGNILLPAKVSITTDGAAPIADKVNYVGATISIAQTDSNYVYSGRASIRGRGHSTWDMPKKPYKIKLDEKAGLLGLPKDKNWVLLANYSDKTLLRNRAAFELGKRLGMDWTPRDLPVEVTLNGEYLGVYDLVESVRVDKNRVNIADTDNTVAPENTGFILEINERLDGDSCWTTTHGVPLCIDTPSPASDAQAAYIRQYVQAAEDALFSDSATDAASGYEKYFDVTALINWYLVNELFKNQDAQGYASIYLYKDVGGKLKFGPLWDFDIGAGNVNYSGAQYPLGWWIADNKWISRMKSVDPTFETRVRAKWVAAKAAQIDTLPAYFDTSAAALVSSGGEARNFQRWPILDQSVWPNPVVTGSYQGEIDYVKNWLQQRTTWLDENL
ncbi:MULTISPECIES: CotH kinase family protein [unclassified Caballeronia]|uniref:CotH kinase family protein n=1 Tax=unclassified Caballeronia TaxID=2646786 RepID=UPI00285A88E5|nr:MULTISPECIES: CotH kinase family protein [unclassified Caballeronia]MDR5814192.1 CotH kinase family protein [Caballeronia sp. LZ033]MDR5878739.1 CotH kinase family protein [Caballeronia sp. LZ032]